MRNKFLNKVVIWFIHISFIINIMPFFLCQLNNKWINICLSFFSIKFDAIVLSWVLIFSMVADYKNWQMVRYIWINNAICAVMINIRKYMWMAQNNAVPEACDCAKKWVTIGLNKESKQNLSLPLLPRCHFFSQRGLRLWHDKGFCSLNIVKSIKDYKYCTIMLPYSDKRKQLLKMTFLVNEQNVSVMYIDINRILSYLDLNIFQQDGCFCSKLRMELEYAKSNLKPSLSQIQVICQLLPFVRIGQHGYYTDIDRDGHEISRFGGLPRELYFPQGIIFSRSTQHWGKYCPEGKYNYLGTTDTWYIIRPGQYLSY